MRKIIIIIIRKKLQTFKNPLLAALAVATASATATTTATTKATATATATATHFKIQLSSDDLKILKGMNTMGFV